ncbi:methylated-DNA--[protein]-cysteine S-methyltransferase [Actinophytocola gossypii]|uniref:Methylated-DNA--protein-cysteine methyltransferase n=1 Tax=Actinophytocola gossypii TaxID=2812003 RepID=A0ABT2JDE4_9PSEU|nr:methylated-DNA--[protein]-cysteine S-methyltransferase [Actinophytocola gossypii]MCT2585875.1 methylated-DNA--[protein]-cysteine S-methyltransferase [Actinophytocola gossypii]
MYTVMDSPVGPLTLVGDEGALSGLYMTDQRHRPADNGFGDRDDDQFADAVTQLNEYFAGDRTEFTVPLRPEGTPFRHTVWQALLEIPYGETITYGELAQRIGRPTAARAVGHANGHNPISIVVPCHRVVGTTGLTGYGGGLDRKRFLLDLETRPR